MAGKTWRDLGRNSTSASGRRAVGERGGAIAQAVQTSPRLGALLEKRKSLETRLSALASGEGEALSPRDAARYSVPSFAERRAQEREWLARRMNLQARVNDRATAGRTSRREPVSQRSAPGNSVRQWLSHRDAQRRSLRDAARDRLSPLNDVARVGRQLQGSVDRASGQLRDLDQKLAEEGLTSEREDLKKINNKLTQATSQIDKYTKMVEAPKRAVEKIDRFWKTRQQQISGAMDKAGPYFDRSQQRLSTTSGGSGDLFERMARNRMRALQRRQEQRRIEARDEARRERARRSKQEEK